MRGVSVRCSDCGQTYSTAQVPAHHCEKPLVRIATALEQLVEIFKQAEDTQNRRLPRDA